LIGGIGTVLAGFLIAASGLQLLLTPAARVDYERAVERARYQFVIGNTKPFDEVYPRPVFEKRVARELAEERVLRRLFGLSITSKLLEEEFQRIEKTTKAPEQWEAIKASLGNDRHLIEDVFCRPLLVDRALRQKFAFDQKIHAGPHQEAREARAVFLAGKTPRGVSVLLLRRGAQPSPTTDELLGEAKKDSELPRVIQPPEKDRETGPVPVEPELAAVLEKELRKPGDVTTILEERDRFRVFRLLAVTKETWKVEAVVYPKVEFDAWLTRAGLRASPQPAKSSSSDQLVCGALLSKIQPLKSRPYVVGFHPISSKNGRRAKWRRLRL
jgi:hypothetical protein